MPYWKECPRCGSHLDPGERCDCEDGPKMPAKKAGGVERKGVRLTWEVKSLKGKPSPPCPYR